MYKYKKLQTLINYIVTKHGNTPQGASKITVSLLVQEVTQRAGTGGQRPERPSPYKNPAVVIPKAMYKLHSRKRGPGARGGGGCLRNAPATSPPNTSARGRVLRSPPATWPLAPSCPWLCHHTGCGRPLCPLAGREEGPKARSRCRSGGPDAPRWPRLVLTFCG